MTIRFAINTYGLAHHFDDPQAMIRTAQLAERAGAQIHTSAASRQAPCSAR